MIYPAGDAIRDARVERGFTQKGLARAAGVTERAVTYWEAGARRPDVESLVKLAGALQVEFVCTEDGVIWRRDPRLYVFRPPDQAT